MWPNKRKIDTERASGDDFSGHRTLDQDNYSMDNMDLSSNFISKPPLRPASAAKTRSRGYSLRSTQFETHSDSRGTNFSSGDDSHDIELKTVENTYNPRISIVNDNDSDGEIGNYRGDSNDYGDSSYGRKSNNIRFQTLTAQESVLDVNDLNSDYSNRMNSLRLSDESTNNNFKTNKNKTSFLRKAFLLLTGGRQELESVGGRRIPITIDITKTDFAIQKTKKGKPLLVDERNNLPYLNNLITSSRYTLASFLPRQLVAQFSKLANCYFMIVAILQLVPSWSTTGTTTTIIPLSIFITIAMLREGWDDVKRHRLDKEENYKNVKVLKDFGPEDSSKMESFSKRTTSLSKIRPSGQSFDFNFEDDLELENKALEENTFSNTELLSKLGVSTVKTKWMNLKVGDIVRLNADDWVPADIIVLSSTNEMGEVFVETMALDGETNLKSKIPNIELHKIANKAKNIFNLSGTITSEDPNLDLYNYEGSLELPNINTQKLETHALGPDNIIYRGSIIRNTEACIGVVVFTGEETKIRMNAIKNPRVKAPKLQKKINWIVAFMVLLVISLSMFSFLGQRILYNEYKVKNWYIAGEDAGVAATIVGYIIMFNTLIPLSLYITMELIKAVQMSLLQWDIDMYHLPSDTPAEARTATILEELGQVSYVFTDKTGTLTDNVMIFRKFSVAGVPWIHDIDLLKKPEDHSDPNDLTDVFSHTSDKPGILTTTGRPSMASLNYGKQKEKKLPNEVDNRDLKSSLEFIKYIQENPQSVFAQKSTMFLLSIALCHTCLPRKVEKTRKSLDSVGDDGEVDEDEEEEEEEEEEEQIEYQASSPDELALVQAACDMGFIVYDRKLKLLTLKTYPNGFEEDPVLTKYEILDIVEFTSSRKRMSVIVKFPDDKIIMFCKGADNIIMERLTNSELVKNKQDEVARSISERKRNESELIMKKQSFDYANPRSPRASFGSLRMSLSVENNVDAYFDHSDENKILMHSKKSFDEQNLKKFSLSKDQYIPPTNFLTDDNFVIERTLQHIEDFSSDGLRTLLYSYKELDVNNYRDWSLRYSEAKTSLVNRGENIERVGEEFENGLQLLGCTAIEDKLQDGVPVTIERLRRAGIRMWMLTGDKRETAINIGYSCKLIKDYSTVIILSKENNDMERLRSIITLTEIEIDEGKIPHCVVVIDGSTLYDIEEDKSVFNAFISLGVKSNSVIVCRASPSQKATMVSKVRSLDKSKVTLAIGDGANDIAMIQSADVGIGITGKEGLQAARTSDYSIAQFRYLTKLLLVHGRYNYIRTSRFVLSTFYKEILFYLSQIMYQRFTLFTGSSLYESWSLSMFNTLFTSLPVLCIGMFDKDLNESTLIAIPELYLKGVNNETFNFIALIQWVAEAVFQSVTISFTVFYIYGFADTLDNTTYPLGVIMFTTFIILINTKLNILEMHNITKLNVISWCVSVIGWALWCILLVGLYQTKENTIFYVAHGLFEEFGPDVMFWACILIVIMIGILISLLMYMLIHSINVSESEKFQILEKDKYLKRKMQLESFDVLKQGWLWLHDSQVNEEDIDADVDVKNIGKHNWRHIIASYLRKGRTRPSERVEMRKRAGTMVNPNELPPEAPSIVIVSSNERYDEEMLPNGEIIRVGKNGGQESLLNRGYRGLFKNKNGEERVGEGDNEFNIDEILRNRAEGLNE